MKLSKKGEYALRAVMELARHHNEDVMQIQEIAKNQNIPIKFLEQILLSLNKMGLLSSKRGAGGGYQLRRPPKAITLGEVVRIVDGPLAPLGCVSKTAYIECIGCPEGDVCWLQDVMFDVRNAIAKILDNITFGDILLKEQKRGFKKVS